MVFQIKKKESTYLMVFQIKKKESTYLMVFHALPSQELRNHLDQKLI